MPWLLLVSTAVSLWLAGCTDVELALANFPTTVSGDYCTDDSDVYDLPTRILLVIDTSKSMEVNDPQGYRAVAAANLISHFASQPNVSFGFVTFNTATTSATDGFTNDPAVLSAALGLMNVREGFTNYLDALGAAQSMVTADIAKVATTLAGMDATDPNRRMVRPWYFVVFLSDGIPRMPGGVLQSTEEILFRVQDLVDVPPEAAGLTLHTAFLGAADDAQRPDAEALLTKMAEKGGGSYTSFENGEEIDFSVFNFQVKRRYDIKQVLVYNRSQVLTDVGPQVDSDEDGIADSDEEQLGSDPLSVDSDGDGCGDGFERAAGLSLTTRDCPCDEEGRIDTDNDGLKDCEEIYLGFDPEKFDGDGDLFPDWLELRFGTNAADADDWKEDLDFDGVPSGEEIRTGMSPIRGDSDGRERYAYTYTLTRSSPIGAAQVCYHYEVENVSLVQTRAVDGRVAGLNESVIETIESPEDTPDKVFKLRRLVIPVRFGKHLEVDGADDEFETVSVDEETVLEE